MGSSVHLALAGDVMLGRGVDQLWSSCSKPLLHERVVRDARQYVAMAEQRHGVIAKPVDHAYPWGEALAALLHPSSQITLVNLESAITRSDQFWPWKGIRYRLHPDNVDALKAAQIDGCCIANNHILDWGLNGLADTRRCLKQAGIQYTGAGLSLHQAQTPMRFSLPQGQALLVFAWGFPSSGIPADWQANVQRPGVAMLQHPDLGTLKWISQAIRRRRRQGDRVVVSLHWGGNWVDQIPEQHRWLAHHLVDVAEVDVVFTHSCHHPLPLEIYRDRLILYGCGDLINDYEGLPSQRRSLSDLGCLYQPVLDASSGALKRLRIVPFQRRQLQLRRSVGEARERLVTQLQLDQLPQGWTYRDEGNAWSVVQQRGRAEAD